jgi:hypothetical protein
VKVEDVVVRVSEDDPTKLVDERRILLLKEKGGDRMLCIWVRAADGDTLASQLTEWSPPRPMTSDLMVDVVRVLGGQVERVAVTELRDKTFYATVSIAVDGNTEELDARPSDAINLAVRVGAPILVDEGVLEEAGMAPDSLAERLDQDAEGAQLELPPGQWTSLSAELLRRMHQ